MFTNDGYAHGEDSSYYHDAEETNKPAVFVTTFGASIQRHLDNATLLTQSEEWARAYRGK